jgi:hypothetical protein
LTKRFRQIETALADNSKRKSPPPFPARALCNTDDDANVPLICPTRQVPEQTDSDQAP